MDDCLVCPDAPCARMEGVPGALRRLREYRELGRKGWIALQRRRADLGFELHTGKYYRIEASEDPLAQ